jgi:asparagine synthase (glutamine-hydrolysing)
MPGIAGIISSEQKTDCERLVDGMIASMRHETFYVSGTHFVPAMGVYAGWVAHKNSFAASQVFFNETQDIALIFSGECFVDPQVSIGLRQKGHRLKENNRDWLVHLYEEEENLFFEKLNGTFSGLLIDRRQSKAFLFNDRYGVDRIYWHEDDGSVYFASEAKALLRILPRLRDFDERGVAEFLTFGCTLDDRTLFRGVEILPGASLWSFRSGRCQRAKYFLPQAWETQPALSPARYEAELQETFKAVLPRYFESESRIGISLTGGLDSRMIMACRQPNCAPQPLCYTFEGPTSETIDTQLAARVAKACGLDHHILRLGPNFFSDFGSHVDRTVYATDGYFGVVGAHEIYLNSLASQFAPTRLTGNYGGEILRGISTFKPLGLIPELPSQEISRLVRSCAQRLTKGHPVTFAAFRELPWNLFGRLRAAQSQVAIRTPYIDNEIVALAYRTPEELLGSSQSGLDFVRRNDPALQKIPTDKGQLSKSRGLGEALRRFQAKVICKVDYLNSEGFPPRLSLLDPVITGLASTLRLAGTHKYLPYRTWFRRELARYVADALEDAQARQSTLWNSEVLANMAEDHIHGRKNYVREIDAVITLAAIDRLLFRGLPTKLHDPTASELKSHERQPVKT